MNTIRTLLVGLLAPLMLAGCLMVPGPQGVGVTVAPLPPVVVLDAEPYYVHQGYYYYYRDNGWYYSRSRSGPWADLPRDRYPREVRYRNGGPQRGEGRDPRHEGR